MYIGNQSGSSAPEVHSAKATKTGFWIYEDLPTNRCSIHAGDCGFCNHGTGTKRKKKSAGSGHWHGPFETLESAQDRVAEIDRPLGIHICCGAKVSVPSQPYERFLLEPIDEATASLDQVFHQRMLEIYVALRDEIDYKATRFFTAVRKHGGVAHAKRSLRRPVQMQEGFQRLAREGRLHQSMEACVCDPKFRTLFTPGEIAEARRRLNRMQTTIDAVS